MGQQYFAVELSMWLL